MASCGRHQTLDQLRPWDGFFSDVERKAFRMAQLATHDQEEALDLVQDAMLKLVQRYAHKPETEWKPLFYKILHNGIRDWQRRTWIRTRWRVWFGQGPSGNEETSESLWESLPDPTISDPASQLDQTRAMTLLKSTLRMLPPRQREAFLLRAWEGLDIAQTAQAMGCSTGSVKTHYSRAVHTLRDHLAEYASLINEK